MGLPESEAKFNSQLRRESISNPELPTYVDVVIVGGGITGLSCAKALGNTGIETLVIEKQCPPPLKSLFIQGKVLENHGLLKPLLSGGEALSPVNNLYIRSIDIEQEISKRNSSNSDPTKNYYALRHPLLIRHLQKEVKNLAPTVTLALGEKVAEVVESKDKVELVLAGGEKINASYLIDTSGEAIFSRGIKGKDHRPLVGDNPVILWIFGYRVWGEFDKETLYGPIGRDIGKASWILPYSENEADLIAAGYCHLSQRNKEEQRANYQRLKKYVIREGMCQVKKEEEQIYGFIRLKPIPSRSAQETNRVFILGAAAGMGSPLMAEVMPVCLEWGVPLAQMLENNITPLEFYRTWRFLKPYFPYDREMAMLRLRTNNPLAGVNFPIYKAILRWLPEKVQREVLLTRRIPLPYYLFLLPAILTSPNLARYLPKLLKEYLHVKIKD